MKEIAIACAVIAALTLLAFGLQQAAQAVACHSTADKMSVQSDYVPGSGCWVRKNNQDPWKVLS